MIKYILSISNSRELSKKGRGVVIILHAHGDFNYSLLSRVTVEKYIEIRGTKKYTIVL